MPGQLLSGLAVMHSIERRARPRSYELPPGESAREIREKLRAEIEDRLMDVCSNWSTGEFDRVVEDVTQTTLKFHGVE